MLEEVSWNPTSREKQRDMGHPPFVLSSLVKAVSGLACTSNYDALSLASYRRRTMSKTLAILGGCAVRTSPFTPWAAVL